MKKGQTTTMVLFGLAGVLLLLFFIFNDDGKHYRWYESYRASSDQPYGTLFIQKMLENYRPGRKFIVNDKQGLDVLLLDGQEKRKTDYIFIGQSCFLDYKAVSALVKFIESGGNAFIASLEPPIDIINAIYFKECGEEITFRQNEVEGVNLSFFHSALKEVGAPRYVFRYGSDDVPYSWSYIDSAVFCDSTRSIVPLGYMNDQRVNFIKISAGKGNLYLHSNPLVFTNYFLTQPAKVDYVAGVFSHLDGENIIWDEFSKIPFTGNDNAYNSPLYYILDQPSLKYAWWMMLITVLLYILFVAKRRQRIIPVLEPKTNTSLEFVNLISRLYYRNGNHVDMARKKMKYFLYFVRSRYGIQTDKFSDEHIRKLAEKSKVSHGVIEVIFFQYYLIEEKFRENIEANRLADLYFAIDSFYKQCK
jgi:hypothetical protein